MPQVGKGSLLDAHHWTGVVQGAQLLPLGPWGAVEGVMLMSHIVPSTVCGLLYHITTVMPAQPERTGHGMSLNNIVNVGTILCTFLHQRTPGLE